MRGEALVDLNIDFNLFRSQKLLLSPHLKQAMEILEMDSQQLAAYVEEQAEANPVLEISCSEELSDDEPVFAEEETPAGVTLKEYLLLQLDSVIQNDMEKAIGEYLIDNTDENGYLKADIDETALFFGVPAAQIGRVLQVLQSLDPPGICARSLKECLLIQLRQNEEADSSILEIVDRHLDGLAAGDTAAIAEATGLSAERIREVFKTIRTLEPRPGREFYPDDGIRSVVPDVLVKKINDEFLPLMNEEAVPFAAISEYYSQMEDCEVSADDRAFIRSRLNSAIWMIKCMEQRKDIIFRIAEFIVKRQEDFLEQGFRHLKSIDLRDIADELDIHEMLVRSALKGKYLQCRWGTFELAYFCKA